MQYRLLNTKNSIQNIKKEWMCLETKSHPFQSFYFVEAWLGTLGKNIKPFVVACYDGAEVVAILPFAIYHRKQIPYLGWLGGIDTVDYGDILCKEGVDVVAIVSEAFDFIKYKTIALFVLLTNVREDAKIAHFCKEAKKTCSSPAPYILLDGDFESYWMSRRSKFRSDTARSLRVLEDKLGSKICFSHAESQDDKNIFFSDLVSQKLAWHFATNTYGPLLSADGVEFYKKLLDMPCVKISATHSEDKVISVHFGFVDNGRFYYLVPTYDGSLSNTSPGRLMCKMLIEDCYRNNVKYFDFCIGAEKYKSDWTTDAVEVANYLLPWRFGKFLKRFF